MAPLLLQEPATPPSLGGPNNQRALLASDGIPPQTVHASEEGLSADMWGPCRFFSPAGAGEEGGEAAVARRLVSAA